MPTQEEYDRRKAEFISPAWTLSGEEMKAQVEESFRRLAQALASLSDAQAAWKPAEDEWSAAQVGDHIALGTGAVSNIIDLLARGQPPTDEDWDPPPQFRGDPADLAGIRKRLDSLPAAAAALFDRCLQTDRMDVTAENSVFGQMNWREWYYFLRVHALDHLQQVEKLRSAAGFPA